MSKTLYCKLEPNLIPIIKDNPHTGEFFCPLNKIEVKNSNSGLKNGIIKKKSINAIYNKPDPSEKYRTKENYKNPQLIRTLDPKFPKLPYMLKYHKLTTLIHWGQRKLLLSEIEFLTNYAKDNEIIIYAGAAPGQHVGILANMFPKQKWVLIDPREFSPNIKNIPNIYLINDYLTKDLSKKLKKKFKNQKLLLISDIRTGIDVGKTESPSEQEVYDDMNLQKQFHKLLQPEYSQFKFRLPWSRKTQKYFDGTVYLQVWARETSAETRLVVSKNAKEKNWDNKKYEENMSYFNQIMRPQYYTHDYDAKCMDHCYDCSAEFHILKEYYSKYGNKKNTEKEFIERTADYFTDELSRFGKNQFILDYKIL